MKPGNHQDTQTSRDSNFFELGNDICWMTDNLLTEVYRWVTICDKQVKIKEEKP